MLEIPGVVGWAQVGMSDSIVELWKITVRIHYAPLLLALHEASQC